MNNQLLNVNPYSLGDFNNGEYMLATESIYEKLGLGKSPSESELVACAKQLIELSEVYYYKLHGYMSMRECFRRMAKINENSLEEIIHRESCLDDLFKPTNKTQQKQKSIYILKAGEFYKIGIANDVNKRIEGLQTGCPLKITLIHSLLVEDAYKLERLLHRQLKQHKTHGEWFRLSRHSLRQITKTIKENI